VAGIDENLTKDGYINPGLGDTVSKTIMAKIFNKLINKLRVTDCSTPYVFDQHRMLDWHSRTIYTMERLTVGDI
jgi:hypothetical protein